MNIKELTSHLDDLNENMHELIQNPKPDLYALEIALYDLAEHLQLIREGNKS